ncbi:hypothetical protein [Pseudoxanthomonas sp. PXM01]|uniref:hypothetical protein n=1 Tax=Pseudoxanthomonas sp. PXM01 TaxID=2769295 RepID=UPI001783F2C7|nr:hypothetical protein [Pseudoxanthomonas sp. PXM01]MBD9468625.1 hypothetical protein [Pseudoxanthomonas sp. PXM01]
MRSRFLVSAILLLASILSPCAQAEEDPQADVVALLSDRLSVNAETAAALHERAVRPVLESGNNTFFSYVDNTSVDGTALPGSASRILVMSVLNDNRFATITLVRLADTGQVFYHVSETLPRDRETALGALSEVKEAGEHTTLAQNEAFSALVATGYVSYTHVLTTPERAGMHFVEAGVVDIE